jgi:hypothetical protein
MTGATIPDAISGVKHYCKIKIELRHEARRLKRLGFRKIVKKEPSAAAGSATRCRVVDPDTSSSNTTEMMMKRGLRSLGVETFTEDGRRSHEVRNRER